MSTPIVIDPGHPKFNLSGPPLPFSANDRTSLADLTSDESAAPAQAANIPGIFFGILVPHIVCTLVILARSWSRVSLLRRWFLDDTLILISFLLSTAVCVIYATIAASPTSTPPPTRATTVISPTTIRTYLALILYQLCLCLTKLSILAFYLRIFSAAARSGRCALERRLAWATVIAVLLFGAPLLFMSVFQCHPSAGLFFGAPMKCFTFAPLLIASASLHTATDAWLIALIVPCVVRLDLPPRQKMALAVVLSLSVFVIAASMTRLQLSLRGAGGGSSLAFFVMTVLELDLALLCASAPTLRLVLARWLPRLGMGDAVVWSNGRAGVPRGGERSLGVRGSVDLTSVVSYHGYPWTEPATPAGRGSKNASSANVGGVANPAPPLPVPPLALVANRAPTTLSLRSFISNMAAPRSRGQGKEGGDREGLLMASPNGAMTTGDADDLAPGRRSSVGLEGYYDQYLPGYGEQERRRSRLLGLKGDSRRSSVARYSGRYSGRWMDSQESFVLGMNDPNSPNRLSPVSNLTLCPSPQGPTKKESMVAGSEENRTQTRG